MRVALFVTCLVDLMRPRIGFAAIELLEAAGCEVEVPTTQTCCGQPAWNSGDRTAAAALAKKLIAEFESCGYVVAPSGSCADHIRNEYPVILADDPEWHGRAVALASRVYELTDFLTNVVQIESLPGKFAGSITYHDSCTGLRSMGIKVQPRALLGKLPGVELREMTGAEECCGFGGTFAMRYPDISEAIVTDKVAAIRDTEAGRVVSADCGCLLNITGRAAKQDEIAGLTNPTLPGEHIASFLWRRTTEGATV